MTPILLFAAALSLPSPTCPTGISPDGSTVEWQGAVASAVRQKPKGGDAETFLLTTTAPLRDHLPVGGRLRVQEDPAQAATRTGNALFDGLFALALQEARLDSVEQISDDNFPTVACSCFQTGRLWKYVWTRDVSYSADLGLAWLDPARMAHTLLFKVSDRRSGGQPEVVQDTGSGGAWPVSTDRVVWALGADRLLGYLDGPARRDFKARAEAALAGTLAADDAVAWSPADGLYKGETSFMDWREQSYALWTKDDTAPIAMSRALSTNVLHVAALRTLAKWAAERGDTAAQSRYREQGDALARRVDQAFWLPDAGLYGSTRQGAPDPGVAERFDLLGEALAAGLGVAPPERARSVLSTYPHTCAGAPVLWPEQPDVPVYHNQALWPFVTAYWLKAAKATGHGAALLPNVASLMRGAALNLSNMENFEFTAQRAADPVIDSQRQLWSVAGYLSMVVDVLFGQEASRDGLRFEPFLTPELRSGLFGATGQLRLARFPYLGRTVDVTVNLPGEMDAPDDTRPYQITGVTLNGQALAVGAWMAPATLGATNDVVITLGVPAGEPTSITTLNADDPKAATAPSEAVLTSVTGAGMGAKLTVALPAGAPAFDVYRDGSLAATGLTAATWVDPVVSPTHATCYAVAARDARTGLSSQRSRPHCWWPAGTADVVMVTDRRVKTTGSQVVVQAGRSYLPAWGDAADQLAVEDYRPARTGTYRIQLTYRNPGPINTGITAGVKRLHVLDHATGAEVATSVLVMPHSGTPGDFRDSTYTEDLALTAGRSYDLTLSDAPNMSYFAHFAGYKPAGGKSGPRNTFDLSAIKILAVGAP